MELKAGMWIRMNSKANKKYTLSRKGSYGVIETTAQDTSIIKFATLTNPMCKDINLYNCAYKIENTCFKVLPGCPSTDILINYLLRWNTMDSTELTKIGNYLGNYQGGKK